MRRTLQILLVVLGLLGVSHLVAVTTESQAAAQFSWILIGTIAVLAVFYVVESAYLGYRSGNAN